MAGGINRRRGGRNEHVVLSWHRHVARRSFLRRRSRANSGARVVRINEAASSSRRDAGARVGVWLRRNKMAANGVARDGVK